MASSQQRSNRTAIPSTTTGHTTASTWIREQDRRSAHKNTCHYHTHSLEVLAGIKGILVDHQAVFEATTNGWRLFEAMDALLTGAGEATGQAGSVNAIYQFYRSESPTYKLRRQGCDYGEVLNDVATGIYAPIFQ